MNYLLSNNRFYRSPTVNEALLYTLSINQRWDGRNMRTHNYNLEIFILSNYLTSHRNSRE